MKERPGIRTDWFASAARGDSIARARVAVRLLREGEISCADFMRLVYGDILLHAIETIDEYSVKLDDDATRAPILYLLKIAQQSLRQEHILKLQQLQKEIEKLEGEAEGKKLKEMLDYILSVDSWAQAKAKVLQDPVVSGAMSAEQQLALREEIQNRANNLSIELEPDERRAMERNLAFWRGRTAASKTMVLSAGKIADQQDVSVVAMIVGAAHTDRMCAMLGAADRPYAVVTPLSLKNYKEGGDVTWDMLERKYERLSIYSEGFTKTLLEAFPPPKQKKPEPVLSEAWFQGKAELYLFTERIVGDILGPPNPPAGGGPPYGIPDDAFKGRWVSIDPKRISIISDTEDGKGRTVLFPVMLNPNDPIRRKEIWVKAGLGVAMVAGQERESVESMLQKALEEVQSEKKPGTKVEDRAGRVQITLNTVGAFGSTRQAVMTVVLGAI